MVILVFLVGERNDLLCYKSSRTRDIFYFVLRRVLEVKEIEGYVRSCDPCQRMGKGNEKVKAPLKLVPIIREVFSKMNIDAVGPLSTSSKGNSYLLTAICMSSRYPEAIPVADISSVSVPDALLEIFSKMGFQRQIQSDLGSSFTSLLTT
ncbi:hypothetical protein AVEN_206966-1 [Araneus ventricosus]|uniref:Integrase catalytic domain-containing protein n=1 Tax=Araneus ventricosus TaxID=182803 RepID=A0A4Y2S3M4_ARAVE|nr:hypothetical protein AVEN_206966-1 [Araneus ventricosus]